MFLSGGAVLLTALGVAQRMGWISAGHTGDSPAHHQTAAGDVQYICPMICTPPQSEPGRCPVCDMELVPASSGSGPADSQSIRLDPAARRVANIQTVTVQSKPVMQTIRAVGRLTCDEGRLKSISAYVDGRIERLYADYTGVVVQEGDHLALVYSPRLYSAQVEFLLARKALNQGSSAVLDRLARTNRSLYDSARHRLIELGMTEPQVAELEQAGEASSRLHLCAPISGTVIQKRVVEGQYVKEGEAIFELADLSTVWLMLELFPGDAAAVRYGQKVEAELQSLPGRVFAGRVAFVDPDVDPETHTVGVRVVLPNPEGVLKVGDYARATITAPIGSEGAPVYDPELASRWISPRHPHVVSTSAGVCPVCGIDLVPARQLGFTDQPVAGREAVVVPQNAVLMAGNSSVVYVETEPGRFEIRRVVPGPLCGDGIVIRSGLREGEHVATRGNFLIDSQMQLAGNPSLIDPARVKSGTEHAPASAEVIAALAELPADDRRLAETQRICPVTGMALGTMGTPLKVDVNGRAVLICCGGCEPRLLAEPENFLQKLAAPEAEESTGPPPPADGFEIKVPLPDEIELLQSDDRRAVTEPPPQNAGQRRSTAAGRTEAAGEVVR